MIAKYKFSLLSILYKRKYKGDKNNFKSKTKLFFYLKIKNKFSNTPTTLG